MSFVNNYVIFKIAIYYYYIINDLLTMLTSFSTFIASFKAALILIEDKKEPGEKSWHQALQLLQSPTNLLRT